MAASKGSKYRFLLGKEFQLRECYQGLRLGRCATDTDMLKVNTEFFACPWSDEGTLAIVPLSAKGAAMPEEPALLRNDRVPILDFAWNPFNNHVLATSDQTGQGALWNIPEGGLKSDLVAPSAQMIGHTARLLHISWNNRAENTLISIDSTKVVKLWDVAGGAGVEKAKLSVAHKGLVTSVTWNNTGTQFATSCQDKKLRIVDPRSDSVVAEVDDHSGSKSGRACWLGKLNLILTTGFTRTTTRELALWDPRKMDKRIHTTKLDNPSTSTPLVLFDEDTSVAFICGKGDSSILPYEVQDGSLTELTTFKSKEPQTALSMLPKSVCDVDSCEIARFFKLTPAGQVIPLNFCVPRRHVGDFFQDDIYPPTWDCKPTMSSAEFWSGANAEPNYVSMDPADK